MTQVEFPVDWTANPRARDGGCTRAVSDVLQPGASRVARDFHRHLPGYRITPLKGLPHLAAKLGLGGIWVKDEAQRLSLSSFKVLGGSFAIYRFVEETLGLERGTLTWASLWSAEVRRSLGDLTFSAATDGNHGRGVAWAASQLGFPAVIYVPRDTAEARIHAIERHGARVEVIDGTYDEAVARMARDAAEQGWQVISDTSWDGYEDIPRWVMQGYTTMLSEAQEQLAGQGLAKPSHVFVQAGVGALAASTIAFYAQLFGDDRPISLVVEPTRAACLLDSVRAGDGSPHDFPGDLATIMAGLSCGRPSPLAWNVLWNCADHYAACPDYVAAKGMRVYGVPLEGDPFVVSGESGAVTLGMLMFIMEHPQLSKMRAALGLDGDAHVLLLNTEGNTDPEDFRRIVWEGENPVPREHRAITRPQGAGTPARVG